MGYTDFSHHIFTNFAPELGSILELGNQTCYFNALYGCAAKLFLEGKGYRHVSIDLNGKDGAIPMDLAQPINLGRDFDVVTDFGTSEHVSDIKMCWKNKFYHCKVGGIIISENPERGSWPQHGLHYYTEHFYKVFAALSGMEILELGRHAAMGNDKDGWNVYCVLKKTLNSTFPENNDIFEELNGKT